MATIKITYVGYGIHDSKLWQMFYTFENLNFTILPNMDILSLILSQVIKC